MSSPQSHPNTTLVSVAQMAASPHSTVSQSDSLRDFWHPALSRTKLRRGHMNLQTRLGLPLLLCRD